MNKLLLVSVCVFAIACASEGTKLGKEAGNLTCQAKKDPAKSVDFLMKAGEIGVKAAKLEGSNAEDYVKALAETTSGCL